MLDLLEAIFRTSTQGKLMNLEHDLICPLKFKLCSGLVVTSGLGGSHLKALAVAAEVAVFIACSRDHVDSSNSIIAETDRVSE